MHGCGSEVPRAGCDPDLVAGRHGFLLHTSPKDSSALILGTTVLIGWVRRAQNPSILFGLDRFGHAGYQVGEAGDWKDFASFEGECL
jgi:hypothetical protein